MTLSLTINAIIVQESFWRYKLNYNLPLPPPYPVSRSGHAVRRWAGKRKDLGSIQLRLSFLFKKVVVCGHCLVTLSFTINETLKWLPPLPIIVQESF